MRARRAPKAKRVHRQKTPMMPNGQVRTEKSRQDAPENKPSRPLSQADHLQGLWVTLGLADVAD